MSVRTLSATIFALIVFGGGLGFAVAQNEDEGTMEDAPEGGEMDVRQRADLTPEEQLEQARVIYARGEDLSRRVQSMLDEARQERDIIRVTCINDKLTQVNANLRTAEQRISQLEDAIAAEDSGRRNHEFTVIIVLGQKFVVLDREAVQCIGNEIYETGATRVITEIDPGAPVENPSAIPPMHPRIPILPAPGTPDR